MAAAPREPSIRLATRYRSRDIWMTWPSARRTSDGGWLSPEFLNSPSSSTPSASRGTAPGSANPGAPVGDMPGASRRVLAGSAPALTGLHLPDGPDATDGLAAGLAERGTRKKKKGPPGCGRAALLGCCGVPAVHAHSKSAVVVKL